MEIEFVNLLVNIGIIDMSQAAKIKEIVEYYKGKGVVCVDTKEVDELKYKVAELETVVASVDAVIAAYESEIAAENAVVPPVEPVADPAVYVEPKATDVVVEGEYVEPKIIVQYPVLT
jgi:hypothetical protein